MRRRRRRDELPPDRPGITDPRDSNRLDAALREGEDALAKYVERFELARWAKHTSPFVLLAYELLEKSDPSMVTPGTRAWLCRQILDATQTAEQYLIHAITFKDADAAEDSIVNAFEAGRRVERLLVKLTVEPVALRGIRTDPEKATRLLSDRATKDNARLARRFKELREQLGTRDEDGDLDRLAPKGRAYAAIAKEVKSGKLALDGKRRPTTEAAVRQRVKAYLSDIEPKRRRR